MTEYNGWTNWETWNVALWIDNDEYDYHYWQRIARTAAIQPEGYEDDAVPELAQQLEAYIQPTPDFDENDSLDDVNWEEIAESILGDLDQN
jgi:hypothetical protein